MIFDVPPCHVNGRAAFLYLFEISDFAGRTETRQEREISCAAFYFRQNNPFQNPDFCKIR